MNILDEIDVYDEIYKYVQNNPEVTYVKVSEIFKDKLDKQDPNWNVQKLSRVMRNYYNFRRYI